MTSHPLPENASCWWLTCGKWRTLHAVPAALISQQRMRDAIDTNEPIVVRSVCGLRRGWWYPGLISRLAKPRCAGCCAALGVPAGYGTPVNEADLADAS